MNEDELREHLAKLPKLTERVRDCARIEEQCKVLESLLESGTSAETESEEDEEIARMKRMDERNNLIVEIGHLLIKTGIVDTYTLPR